MSDRNDKLKTCPHCGGAKFRINIITGGLMTCPTCDGTGEIEEKRQSNFANITESPEKLAEFLTQHVNYPCCICKQDCPAFDCALDTKEKHIKAWMEWLEQESKE